MNFFVKYLETDPKFKTYYKNILKCPLLTREEEVRLFKRQRAGVMKAVRKLFQLISDWR